MTSNKKKYIHKQYAYILRKLLIPSQNIYNKNKNIAIGSMISKWINKFLKDRTYLVKIGKKKKTWKILNGVPQESATQHSHVRYKTTKRNK